jgi:dTDP-glucose pyrophosphorylase
VIATLLRDLVAAGCTDLTVVTGHLAEQLEQLLGDGSFFGVRLRYVRQPSPVGSADAVARALAAGAAAPAIVVAADTVFDPGAVARFRTEWEASGAPGALAIRHGQPRSGGKLPLAVEGANVVRVVVDDADDAFTAAPLWGLGEALVPELEGLHGPPFELGEAYQNAIDAGREVHAVLIGGTRDVTAPADLIVENFVYLADEPSANID